ncbi:MAG: hypothetical protein M1826_006037 [Phylliscum demangeonii]|nr:MAG: hypothetical protein M1826_006037 [Phylliscum demangeonii]
MGGHGIMSGVELFKRYICPGLDPESLTQLAPCDRWWLSALLYTEPRFDALLKAELGSYRSGACLQANKRKSNDIDGLDYLANVFEILNASPLERETFLSWVSLAGTGAMLRPLISRGLSLQQKLNFTPSYLSAAALTRNLDTFRVLLAAGACTRNSDDALAPFNGLPRSLDDAFYIDGLLKATPTNAVQNPDGRRFLSSYWLGAEGCPPDEYVARRLIEHGHASFCHPPYTTGRYLGVEVLKAVYFDNVDFLNLLIENEAGLECTSECIGLNIDHPFTVLEMAINFGRDRVLGRLIHATHGSENRVEQLKKALAEARRCLAQNHPRYGMPMGRFIQLIGIEDDREMEALVCQALRDAGYHEHLDESTAAPAKERPQASDDGLRRSAALLYASTHTKSKATILSLRKRYARFRYSMAAFWDELVSLTGFQLALLVLGTGLGLWTIALYHLWEMACWMVSIPRPSRVVVRTALVALLAWLVWRYVPPREEVLVGGLG